MRKRLTLVLFAGAVAGVLVISFNPVSTTFMRLALLCSIAAAWGSLVAFGWRKPYIRWSLLALPIAVGGLLLLPTRELDREAIREDYVSRMQGLEGTRYYWGGESSRGIDCSGLPRRALRESLAAYGIKRLDGGALRLALEQWWYDASASALANGYRQYTFPLEIAGRISEMDCGALLPGDLAVTDDGIHVLAYADGDRWIQADPGIGFVATLDGRKDRNPWFRVPVTIYRWSVLAE